MSISWSLKINRIKRQKTRQLAGSSQSNRNQTHNQICRQKMIWAAFQLDAFGDRLIFSTVLRLFSIKGIRVQI